jgi:hypothetical protein
MKLIKHKMKKYFYLLLLTCKLFTGTAQRSLGEYGFHAGINLNSAYGPSVSKDKAILFGVTAGGHVRINLKKQFGLRLALQYDQYGWAYHSLYFTDNTGTMLGKGDAFFKLNYLNLPVLGDYSFGNKIKFHVAAGMFFGVLLNNWLITKIDEPSTPGQITEAKERSAYRTPTNFGIVYGAGAKLPLTGKMKLAFDLSNSVGLTTVSKGSEIKTNSVAIAAGLIFLVK